jgi:OCT family organic cation transporter-like MFS transporter 4/5
MLATHASPLVCVIQQACAVRHALVAANSTDNVFLLQVGLAYGVHNWRNFTLITGCFSVAGLLLWPFVPESARWLLSQGRQAEATAVVQRIAALNGTRAPSVPLKVMQAKVDPAAEAEEEGMSADAMVHKDADNVVPALPAAASRRGSGEIEAAAVECAVVGGAGTATVPGLPGTQQPGARRIGLLHVLRQPKLLVRTLVLVFTWFSLYIVSYGINLGAGALPGSL